MARFLSRRGEVGNGDSRFAPRLRQNIAIVYNFYGAHVAAAAAT